MVEETFYVQEDAIFDELRRQRDPTNKINTQGKEIFDTNTDTKAHSPFQIGLKHQGLYYASLKKMFKKWHEDHGRGPLSSYRWIIQSKNPDL